MAGCKVEGCKVQGVGLRVVGCRINLCRERPRRGGEHRAVKVLNGDHVRRDELGEVQHDPFARGD